MQTLTPKQKLFGRCVGSGMSLADSYRQAYSAKRMKSASIRVEASRLMSNPDITLLAESIQGQNERAVIVSSLSDRERVLTALRDFMVNADTDSAKIRATELLGKTCALFTDVVETKEQRTPEEIKAELQTLMAQVLDKQEQTH